MPRCSRHYARVNASPPPRPLVRLWPATALLFFLLIMLAPTRAGGGDNPNPKSQALPNLAQIERAFQSVAEQASPSVVGIRVQRRYLASLPDGGSSENTTFEQLVTINGSGTIIDRNGLILTNEHVIQSASEIEIFFHDGQSASASLLSADPRGDMAILKVDRADLTPAKIVDWEAVARGQWTIAIGNPYGLGNDGNLSVSVGVISNLNRKLPGLGEVDDRLYADMIQTTAAIHPGCSGGPLFNIKGELVGVVTAMHTRAPADEGVGFAIPMSPFRRQMIRQLAAGNQVTYGCLGLIARSVRQSERQTAGVGAQVGAVVQQIDLGGPAGEAGLHEGDLIIHYDHQVVRGPGDLTLLVGQTPPGHRVAVEVWRDGERHVLHPVIQRREINYVSWMRGGALLWRGMRITDLTPELRRRMGIETDVSGVLVIDVMRDSAAQHAAINIGDVIESIAQTPIHDTAAFNSRVSNRQGPVKIRVLARGELVIAPWGPTGR